VSRQTAEPLKLRVAVPAQRRRSLGKILARGILPLWLWRKMNARRVIVCTFCLFIGVKGSSCVGEQARTSPPQEVRIDTGHGIFIVPYMYLSGRPSTNETHPTYRVPRFSVAFWMPDGRPKLADAALLGTLRPEEPGRPPPKSSEYVVIAAQITSTADKNAPPAAPELWQNILTYQGTDAFDYRERHGLIELAPKPSKPAVFNLYIGAKDFADIGVKATVLFRCQREDVPPPTNICDGTVTISRPAVTFHFELPQDRMDQVMDAIRRTATFLQSWQEAS
jgi:hypothetical protein